MDYISAKDLKQKLDSGANCTVLDIREPYEYEICSIGGAQIPMAQVAERTNELPKDGEIVVMCRSGKRAEAVANLLESDFNFTNVSILEGGILAWIDQVDQTMEAY